MPVTNSLLHERLLERPRSVPVHVVDAEMLSSSTHPAAAHIVVLPINTPPDPALAPALGVQSSTIASGHGALTFIWVPLAFATLVCFAFANLMLGLAVAQVPSGTMPLGQIGVLGPSFLTCALLLALTLWLYAPATRKALTLSWTDRNQRRAASVIFVGGVVNFGGLVSLTSAYAVDISGAAVTTAIAAGGAVVAAVLSFALFREVLTALEVAGILVAVVGLALMAAVRASGTSALPPVLGLITMAMFGLAAVAQKYVGRTVASWVSSVYFFLAHAAGGFVVLFVALGMAEGGIDHLTFRNSVYAFFSGVVRSVGLLLFMGAFQHGPAGPVAAIGQNNAILLLLLQWSIWGSAPEPLAIVGMVIAALGVVMLAMGRRRKAPAITGTGTDKGQLQAQPAGLEQLRQECTSVGSEGCDTTECATPSPADVLVLTTVDDSKSRQDVS